jgi:hypothetical protein
MPYFQSLVDSAQPHPVLVQLTNDLEQWRRDFLAMNHVCADLGASYLLVHSRAYESFVIAMNRARMEHNESVYKRVDAIDPAVAQLQQSLAAVRRTTEQFNELPQMWRECRRGAELGYAVTLCEHETFNILRTAETARQRWSFITDKRQQ